MINRAKNGTSCIYVESLRLSLQTDGLYVAALPTREPSMSNLILSQSSILTLSHLSYNVPRNASNGTAINGWAGSGVNTQLWRIVRAYPSQ